MLLFVWSQWQRKTWKEISPYILLKPVISTWFMCFMVIDLLPPIRSMSIGSAPAKTKQKQSVRSNLKPTKLSCLRVKCLALAIRPSSTKGMIRGAALFVKVIWHSLKTTLFIGWMNGSILSQIPQAFDGFCLINLFPISLSLTPIIPNPLPWTRSHSATFGDRRKEELSLFSTIVD